MNLLKSNRIAAGDAAQQTSPARQGGASLASNDATRGAEQADEGRPRPSSSGGSTRSGGGSSHGRRSSIMVVEDRIRYLSLGTVVSCIRTSGGGGKRGEK